VRPTTDGRGNGAFAAKPIPAGTYIGDYEGELLDEAAYWARYPSGVVPSCHATGLSFVSCVECFAFVSSPLLYLHTACAKSHGCLSEVVLAL